MTRIRNIIFDFDGTLADTLPLLFHTSVRLFAAYDNREISREEFRSLMGPSEIEIIRKTLKNRASVEPAVEFFVAEYENNHEAMVERNEEIADLLQELHGVGVGLALFTGKSRRTLDISLAKLDWNLTFDQIVTGDDVLRSKPDPEGIERIVNNLKWNREETVYVGDSNDDMLAGRDAGLRTLAARWMSMVQDQVYQATPHRQFYTLDSFRSYLSNRIA